MNTKIMVCDNAENKILILPDYTASHPRCDVQCRMWSYRGDEYQNYGLLGSDTAEDGGIMFLRNTSTYLPEYIDVFYSCHQVT